MAQQAFSEMRYESYRNYKLKTIRGDVSVDVYARNISSSIPTLILCECKYWEKSVPQAVIHGFRSVCSDAGAHFGIIISKNGFQSGAESSRSATNVHLMNFEEFQKNFFREWQTGASIMWAKMRDQLLPIYNNHGNMLRSETDIAERNGQERIDIFKKYSVFFGTQGAYFTGFGLGTDPFSVEIYDPRGDPYQINRIAVHSRRQYLEIARQAVVEATRRFNLPVIYFDDEGREIPIGRPDTE